MRWFCILLHAVLWASTLRLHVVDETLRIPASPLAQSAMLTDNGKLKPSAALEKPSIDPQAIGSYVNSQKMASVLSSINQLLAHCQPWLPKIWLSMSMKRSIC